jgi:hypothetical protein
VRTFGFAFVAHGDAGFVQQLGVPCCSQGGTAWETGCFDAVEEFGASDAVWAVRHADCWDTVLREGYGVPPVGAWGFSVRVRYEERRRANLRGGTSSQRC